MSDGCGGGELTDPHPPPPTSAPPRVISKVHLAGAATESTFPAGLQSFQVGNFTETIVNLIGGFAVALFKGWLLALNSAKKLAMRGQKAYSEAGNVAEQTVTSIRTGLITGTGTGGILFVVFSSSGLGVWFGSKLIIEKGCSGGHVINVLTAVYQNYSVGESTASKIAEPIGRKPVIDAYDKSGMVLEDINGDIELREVYFRYPARPDVQKCQAAQAQLRRSQ
ncbi:hypothetical protein ACLOJK_015514 [Asimina triloba]